MDNFSRWHLGVDELHFCEVCKGGRPCGADQPRVVGVGGVFDGKFGCEHWVSFFLFSVSFSYDENI